MNDVLRLEITDLCNLKCEMCWSKNWKHLEMEWKQLENLIYDFKEIGGRCIVLTSREPLLSKNFNKILRLCSMLSMELKLLTNGTLISDDVAKNIVQCNCLNYIAVSLHGNKKRHDEMVGVDGAYSKVISSLKYLNYYKKLYKRDDLEIRLTAVISNNLVKDIEEIISVAEKYLVDLRIQHFMWQPNYIKKIHCKDRGIEGFPSACNISYDDVCKLIIIAKKLCTMKDIDLQIYPQLDDEEILRWYSEDYNHYIEYCENNDLFCEHAMNSIRIRANGDVAFCQYIDINFGNVVNDSLSSIISDNDLLLYRKKVKNGMLFPICYHCCHIKKIKENVSPLEKNEI